MARTTPDPLDAVRNAFSDLGTSRKAAFVLEATFETISQALAETGRRAAETIDDLDIDAWFREPEPADVGAPPPPPPVATAPAAAPKKKPAAKKSGPKKSAGKTAGPRRTPPKDDA
ncbi:hypothetical protein [Rubrivirga sp. IMCC43871]|uniref:hypothetical protein n=1 Tax=Rubrivirga sp. IMCC43871 TaxID=3391575 RepID=UPI0039900F21